MRSSFGASASDTCSVPRMWRFDFVVLLVRMWRLNAFARRILPVPVFLKRFAAPLCVFSFGISSPLLLGHRLCVLHLLGRRLPPGAAGEDHVHLVAFLPRRRLGHRDLGELADQPLENAPADLGMRHL